MQVTCGGPQACTASRAYGTARIHRSCSDPTICVDSTGALRIPQALCGSRTTHSWLLRLSTLSTLCATAIASHHHIPSTKRSYRLDIGSHRIPSNPICHLAAAMTASPLRHLMHHLHLPHLPHLLQILAALLSSSPHLPSPVRPTRLIQFAPPA